VVFSYIKESIIGKQHTHLMQLHGEVTHQSVQLSGLMS
jgi:hypothetical protein